MSSRIARSKQTARTRNEPALVASTASRRSVLLAKIALLVAAAVWVYWPALGGEFVLDDNLLLTDNPSIASPQGLHEFWSGRAVDYWPVTNTSLWIEWRLWGRNPTGYHVTNLLLHIADSLLVWLVLRKLAIPGAFLAALLFAVHPVNVESVAWIAQRKNVLAMLFFLLSIFWYLKADEQPAAPRDAILPRGMRGWYALSFGAFVLAMLSKGSVAVLPILLLLIVWWRRGVMKNDFVRLVPFFVVAAVLTIVNMHFQTQANVGADPIREANALERLLGAGAVIWFYLYKALLPIGLDFIYRPWQIVASDWRWWLPLLAAIAATALLRQQRATWWGRPVSLAWMFFCVALLPVMGFTDVGFMRYSLVSDHYQHIAILAPLSLAAAAWCTWNTRLTSSARTATKAITAIAVGTLAVLAHEQSKIYQNEITLYEATLKANPESCLAHFNVGRAYLRLGQHEQALEHFAEAKRRIPKYAAAEATDLLHAGLPAEAIEYFQSAVEQQPKSPEMYHDLALAEFRSGRTQPAIEHFRQAISLEPKFAEAYVSLGIALSAADQKQEAIEMYRQALQLNRELFEANYNLGVGLLADGKVDEAVQYLQQAARLRPEESQWYKQLALALMQAGHRPEAISAYEQAMKITPDDAELQNDLAVALVQSGRAEAALPHIERAVQLQPDDAQMRAFLAITYKQAGRETDALAAAHKALELAKAQGNAALVQTVEGWLGGNDKR